MGTCPPYHYQDAYKSLSFFILKNNCLDIKKGRKYLWNINECWWENISRISFWSRHWKILIFNNWFFIWVPSSDLDALLFGSQSKWMEKAIWWLNKKPIAIENCEESLKGKSYKINQMTFVELFKAIILKFILNMQDVFFSVE